MRYNGNTVEDVKIAYIGGGSRGWAWGLMSDLAKAGDLCGEVRLYDIDFEAAKHNEEIGKKFALLPGTVSKWEYQAVETIGEAMAGADFVVISILPGTFDEMESDVHTPEKYGIYQSVGDTSGPGGIVRALRTVPMMEEIARAVREYAPDAWVINYTNPMTICVRTLYKVFPEIKAFGCCHEVFGTQKLLAAMAEELYGARDVKREEIRVNVVGVNHFTWFTEAKYRDHDLFADYQGFVETYAESGYVKGKDDNWMNDSFECSHRVKFDLFRRFGYIAAAGDRHLAEFCPGKWYLESPEKVREWGFGLTSVAWRKADLRERLQKSADFRSGARSIEIEETGEEGVNQMRALLGLGNLVTNVNLPNYGQIPNLPLGAVVETNAVFSADSVVPVMAGPLPDAVYGLVARIASAQEQVAQAALEREPSAAFPAFLNDPLVPLSIRDAKALYREMLDNTKEYLLKYGYSEDSWR